jgi:hypothetical protein
VKWYWLNALARSSVKKISDHLWLPCRVTSIVRQRNKCMNLSRKDQTVFILAVLRSIKISLHCDRIAWDFLQGTLMPSLLLLVSGSFLCVVSIWIGLVLASGLGRICFSVRHWDCGLPLRRLSGIRRKCRGSCPGLMILAVTFALPPSMLLGLYSYLYTLEILSPAFQWSMVTLVANPICEVGYFKIW